MPEVSVAAYSYRDDSAVPKFDDSKALFVFDGVCVLCSAGASWIMRNDRTEKVRFTPAQSQLGQSLYLHYNLAVDDTYLLLIEGRAFSKSAGYLQLCKLLGGSLQLLRVAAIIPERVRDWLYDRVAANRYRLFGEVELCALLTPEQRSRLLLEVAQQHGGDPVTPSISRDEVPPP
jgi:predicted DCC family thiol-disulfide oxidoreductase YuxK